MSQSEIHLWTMRRLFDEQEWAFLMEQPSFLQALQRIEQASETRIQVTHEALGLALELLRGQAWRKAG